MEKRFAREAETRRTAYDPIFRDLGLSQNQVNTVMAQLDSLLRGAVKAGDPMQELMIARADFRRAMKAMLGEVRFARYEAFELAKPYRREAGYIQEFAVQKQTPMDPKFNNRLVELLQEFRLDTTETWAWPTILPLNTGWLAPSLSLPASTRVRTASRPVSPNSSPRLQPSFQPG